MQLNFISALLYANLISLQTKQKIENSSTKYVDSRQAPDIQKETINKLCFILNIILYFKFFISKSNAALMPIWKIRVYVILKNSFLDFKRI